MYNVFLQKKIFYDLGAPVLYSPTVYYWLSSSIPVYTNVLYIKLRYQKMYIGHIFIYRDRIFYILD